jgi:hypothetical protein
MENENENENRELIEPKNSFLSSGFMAGSDQLKISISKTQINAAIEYLGITKRKTVSAEFILKLWEVFKVKEFTGKKWYNDENAVFTHFLNSLKYEKIDDAKPAAAKPNDEKARRIIGLD